MKEIGKVGIILLVHLHCGFHLAYLVASTIYESKGLEFVWSDGFTDSR